MLKEKNFNGLSTGGLERELNELLGVPRSDGGDGQEEIEGGAGNLIPVNGAVGYLIPSLLVNMFDCTCLVCR